MLASLKQFFSPSPLRHDAYKTYVQIVEQARKPVFYSNWHVSDTVDGRFDVILLHLFLVLSRLEQESNVDAQSFSRYLSEAFFSDMDRSLREMGSSDTGVSMRIKNMAQAFYGRMKAYTESIGDHGLSEGQMAEALRRNVYREQSVEPEILASLAAYAGRNYQALKGQTLHALQNGALRFSS